MQSWIFRKILFVFLAFCSLDLYASIIKIPPTGGDVKYADLICTEQDKSNIYEIIITLSENGKLSLLLKQGYLKQLGAQINHVHPLKFLVAIFSNPRLKFSMYDIFDDFFKRNGFMDGLGPSLEKEADRNRLMLYLNDFAADVAVPPENIRPYFITRDWENLVRYLMQTRD